MGWNIFKNYEDFNLTCPTIFKTPKLNFDNSLLLFRWCHIQNVIPNIHRVMIKRSHIVYKEETLLVVRNNL